MLVCAGSSAVSAQRAGDYGRFQVILDKQLLGRSAPEAPAVTPAPVPAAPAAAWAAEYRLTMITRDAEDGSIRVGLQNARDNSGFLLIQGEPATHGFQLSDADFDANRATIRFNGNPHVFQLESGAEAAVPPPVQTPGGRTMTRRPPTLAPRRVETVVVPPPVPVEPPEPTRFQSPEELQIHLQNVQMDAIRTGKPPLPIPLTPEMDAQLVQEGVLPPQESE